VIRSKTVLVLAAIVLGGYLGYEIVGTKASEQQALTTAGELAAPVMATCDTDPAAAAKIGEAACAKAAEVVADPAVPTPAKDGKDGDRGPGVRSTEIRADGHLVVIYDDGRQVDAGQVVGPSGVGLAAVVITNGRLVITYSDGRTEDLGRVVGDPGRGVKSIDQVDGRLVITYDDGSTQDAGPLPVAEGPPGPACPAGFSPIETGRVLGADGTSYERSITCVDPASAQPPKEGG
jgi:hypothetical protein